MTKSIPTIQKYMSTTPFSIEKDKTLFEAAELMQKNHIRHLPVTYQNKVEGILSETDINLIRSLKDANVQKLKVYDCFTPFAYSVTPETKLDQVMSEMAEHKYGCTLVIDNEKLVGIFTWIDALVASAELLNTRLKT